MVAVSQATIVCGDISIGWEALANAMAIIWHSGLSRLLLVGNEGQIRVS
jgi:hypothetical protein